MNELDPPPPVPRQEQQEQEEEQQQGRHPQQQQQEQEQEEDNGFWLQPISTQAARSRQEGRPPENHEPVSWLQWTPRSTSTTTLTHHSEERTTPQQQHNHNNNNHRPMETNSPELRRRRRPEQQQYQNEQQPFTPNADVLSKTRDLAGTVVEPEASTTDATTTTTTTTESIIQSLLQPIQQASDPDSQRQALNQLIQALFDCIVHPKASVHDNDNDDNDDDEEVNKIRRLVQQYSQLDGHTGSSRPSLPPLLLSVSLMQSMALVVVTQDPSEPRGSSGAAAKENDDDDDDDESLWQNAILLSAILDSNHRISNSSNSSNSSSGHACGPLATVLDACLDSLVALSTPDGTLPASTTRRASHSKATPFGLWWLPNTLSILRRLLFLDGGRRGRRCKYNDNDRRYSTENDPTNPTTTSKTTMSSSSSSSAAAAASPTAVHEYLEHVYDGHDRGFAATLLHPPPPRTIQLSETSNHHHSVVPSHDAQPPPNVTSLGNGQPPQNDKDAMLLLLLLLQQEWMQRLLRIPRLISNAYYYYNHNHHKGSSIRNTTTRLGGHTAVPWEWTSPRYLQSLLERSTHDVLRGFVSCRNQDHHNDNDNNNNHDMQKENGHVDKHDKNNDIRMNQTWWINLIRILLQQQQGSAADIITSSFLRRFLQAEQQQQQPRSDNVQAAAATTRQPDATETESPQLLSFPSLCCAGWNEAMSLLGQHLSLRELALLCRSFLLWLSANHYSSSSYSSSSSSSFPKKQSVRKHLGRNEHNNSKPDVQPQAQPQAHDWMEGLVHTLLSFSPAVPEAVVRTCLLTSSTTTTTLHHKTTHPSESPSPEMPLSRGLLGPTLATVLHRLPNTATRSCSRISPVGMGGGGGGGSSDGAFVVEDDPYSWNDNKNKDESTSMAAYKTPLLRQLNYVAMVWGSTVFVRQTDPVWQSQVVGAFLVQGLNHLLTTTSSSSSPPPPLDPAIHDTLVSALLQGTTLRLESSITSIRLDGMRVGQALAACLGQALQFDELQQYDQQQEKEEQEEKSRQEELTSKQDDKDTTNSTKPPDANYVSDDNDDDSVWDNDDDDQHLRPYSLDDDEEDLQETPRPLYLRDALELLRTPETDERACSHHETALRALPALIRQQQQQSPHDLPDVAVDLAVQVLHQENKYDMPQFGECKQAGLVALLVTEPMTVGLALITDAFGSCSLLTRLHILAALQDGAYELSGYERLEQDQLDSPPKQKQLGGREDRVHGKRRLVAAGAGEAKAEANSSLVEAHSIPDKSHATSMEEQNLLRSHEQRTRRWGRGRMASQPPSSSRTTTNTVSYNNRFAPVAPHWFYALLGHFVQRRQDATLWDGTLGARFLAHLLLAMGTLVELTGPGFGTTTNSLTMAQDLWTLAWGFGSAEIPELRAAALSGVASALACFQQQQQQSSSASFRLIQFLQQLEREQQHNGFFLQGLQEVASTDPDPHCRQLAVGIASQIQKALATAQQAQLPSSSSSSFFLP